jgi:hypothetical protein
MLIKNLKKSRIMQKRILHLLSVRLEEKGPARVFHDEILSELIADYVDGSGL